MAVISLAKKYDPAKAALLFGDLIMGFSIGFVPMRAEMVRAARAEAEGVTAVAAKRPVYIGLPACFAIYIVLFILEYAVFIR